MFQVFHLSSDVCSNVSYGCFKSKLGVAHVVIALVAGKQRLAVGLRLLLRAFLVFTSSLSSPLLSSPLSLSPPPFPPSCRGSSSWARKPYPTSARTPAEVVAPPGRPRAAQCPHGGPAASQVYAVCLLCMGNRAARGVPPDVQALTCIRNML
jgi:hypothetical protein